MDTRQTAHCIRKYIRDAEKASSHRLLALRRVFNVMVRSLAGGGGEAHLVVSDPIEISTTPCSEGSTPTWHDIEFMENETTYEQKPLCLPGGTMEDVKDYMNEMQTLGQRPFFLVRGSFNHSVCPLDSESLAEQHARAREGGGGVVDGTDVTTYITDKNNISSWTSAPDMRNTDKLMDPGCGFGVLDLASQKWTMHWDQSILVTFQMKRGPDEEGRGGITGFEERDRTTTYYGKHRYERIWEQLNFKPVLDTAAPTPTPISINYSKRYMRSATMDTTITHMVVIGDLFGNWDGFVWNMKKLRELEFLEETSSKFLDTWKSAYDIEKEQNTGVNDFEEWIHLLDNPPLTEKDTGLYPKETLYNLYQKWDTAQKVDDNTNLESFCKLKMARHCVLVCTGNVLGKGQGCLPLLYIMCRWMQQQPQHVFVCKGNNEINLVDRWKNLEIPEQIQKYNEEHAEHAEQLTTEDIQKITDQWVSAYFIVHPSTWIQCQHGFWINRFGFVDLQYIRMVSVENFDDKIVLVVKKGRGENTTAWEMILPIESNKKYHEVDKDDIEYYVQDVCVSEDRQVLVLRGIRKGVKFIEAHFADSHQPSRRIRWVGSGSAGAPTLPYERPILQEWFKEYSDVQNIAKLEQARRDLHDLDRMQNKYNLMELPQQAELIDMSESKPKGRDKDSTGEQDNTAATGDPGGTGSKDKEYTKEDAKEETGRESAASWVAFAVRQQPPLDKVKEEGTRLTPHKYGSQVYMWEGGAYREGEGGDLICPQENYRTLESVNLTKPKQIQEVVPILRSQDKTSSTEYYEYDGRLYPYTNDEGISFDTCMIDADIAKKNNSKRLEYPSNCPNLLTDLEIQTEFQKLPRVRVRMLRKDKLEGDLKTWFNNLLKLYDHYKALGIGQRVVKMMTEDKMKSELETALWGLSERLRFNVKTQKPQPLTRTDEVHVYYAKSDKLKFTSTPVKFTSTPVNAEARQIHFLGDRELAVISRSRVERITWPPPRAGSAPPASDR